MTPRRLISPTTVVTRLQDPGGDAGACAHDQSAERRPCRGTVAHQCSQAGARQVQRRSRDDEAHDVDEGRCCRRGFRTVRVSVDERGRADQ